MNLANWFRGCPTGWCWRAGTCSEPPGETEEARNYLLTGTKRGIPVYTEGVTPAHPGSVDAHAQR